MSEVNDRKSHLATMWIDLTEWAQKVRIFMDGNLANVTIVLASYAKRTLEWVLKNCQLYPPRTLLPWLLCTSKDPCSDINGRETIYLKTQQLHSPFYSFIVLFRVSVHLQSAIDLGLQSSEYSTGLNIQDGSLAWQAFGIFPVD